MRVKIEHGYRYLLDGPIGDEDRLVAFGKEDPEFNYPDLRLGFCEDQLETLDAGSVDLIIDDPPYGTTKADWDAEPDWAELAEQYDRVMADDATLVVFGKQPSLIPVYNAFTNGPFDFRFEMIWKKRNNPWVSDHQPIPIHENLFVFAKSSTKVGDLTFDTDAVMYDGVDLCPKCDGEQERGGYSITVTNERKSNTQGGWQDEYLQESDEKRYPISYLDDHLLDTTALPSHQSLDGYIPDGNPKEAVERLRQLADLIEESTNRDVLEFTSVGGTHEEYTGYAGQKPVALLRWLILAMSERADTVLDPHMGSGSTQVASIPLCRESIGFEVNPNRFKIAEERIEELLEDLRGLKHCTVTEQKAKAPSKAD